MNPKSTELNPNFDYPNDREFGRKFFQLLAFCIAGGILSATLALICLCHADAIDKFFSEIIKKIFI